MSLASPVDLARFFGRVKSARSVSWRCGPDEREREREREAEGGNKGSRRGGVLHGRLSAMASPRVDRSNLLTKRQPIQSIRWPREDTRAGIRFFGTKDIMSSLINFRRRRTIKSVASIFRYWDFFNGVEWIVDRFITRPGNDFYLLFFFALP